MIRTTKSKKETIDNTMIFFPAFFESFSVDFLKRSRFPGVATEDNLQKRLKISQKFVGKHLSQSLFFNKVAVLLEKILWHR